jgi:hypothetical protein
MMDDRKMTLELELLPKTPIEMAPRDVSMMASGIIDTIGVSQPFAASHTSTNLLA